MLKIYNASGDHIANLDKYEDLMIEEEVSQLNVLYFDVPVDLSHLIEHEGYVEVEGDGKYVIKEKNLNKDFYEIVGMYNLEDLQEYIESKAYVSLTAQEMMDDLLTGTGWSFETSDDKVRTATGVTIDRLDLIYAILRDTFELEIRFDNQAKVIYAESELGEDKGVYFHDEVNLDELAVDADTYDFATRIIPRGKDGLSIEAINDGLPYLENLTYSSKIITRYWSDERYTVIENLKEAAQKKLDVWSKPLKSFSVKVYDLARISGIDILAYAPGDTIEIVDKESGIREKQRIIVRKKYPDEPRKDTITIANRMRQLSDSNREEFDGIKQDFSVIRANFQLLEEAVEGKVSQNEYNTDKEQMEQDYAAFKLEFDNFTVTVQDGGGNNLIKNSVGYAGDKYWEVFYGEMIASQSTWVLQGEAKHGVKMEGSLNVFSHHLDLVAGQTYTLSIKVKKGIAGTFEMSLDEHMTGYLYQIIQIPAGEEYDGIVSFEFEYDGNAIDPVLSIVSAYSAVEYTDLMLAKGSNVNYWSQANGEVYTLRVQTDADGIKVFYEDGKGYTIMSPEEFAGYYNNQKIFTLNGDITEVMGLEIKGKGLWMRPIKFVQTNDSVDLVWTGV